MAFEKTSKKTQQNYKAKEKRKKKTKNKLFKDAARRGPLS
jgi:hypothetical protein